MRDASELQVWEIDVVTWRRERAASLLPGVVELGELMELASGGRLYLEPHGELGGERVVRLETNVESARDFLVPGSALPLLGLRRSRTDPS